MAVTMYWQRTKAPHEIAQALTALAEEYPLREGEGEPTLEFAPGAAPGAVEVCRQGGKLRISYGAVADAMRGVGAALAGMPDGEGCLAEARPFTTFGLMLDCSRNAVMEVAHIKRWLRRLALLGFNLVMLYTEDTYKLPGEPFFGFMRGAYSAAELKEVDDFAARLGIETVGCIQTLGHLEQILGRGAYRQVQDTRTVALAGEPATYDLIGKMVSTYADSLRSRRIHIGMDEAHDVGRGRYMDIHGYRRAFDIFNEHLAEVVRICKASGLRPMIWSDMYFRMGSKTGDYYDPQSVIPDDVKAAIPKGVDLVYWDYYKDNEEAYLDLIRRHRELGIEPLMASGVWTWQKFWYARTITERNVTPCISACKKVGVKDIFFCMWGDDGGYCEFDSALAGLAFSAAQAYDESEQALRRRYEAVCGISYDQTVLPSKLEDGRFVPIIWDDPLLGINWIHMKARQPGYWPETLAYYKGLEKQLEACREVTEPVDLAHALALVKLAVAKIDFRLRLEEAYFKRDQTKLQQVARRVPKVVRAVDELAGTFRRQWYRRNKPFGFEVIQVRLGGLRQRYLEVGAQLKELLDGRRERIAELDEGAALPQEALAQRPPRYEFRSLIASSVLGP